MRRAINTGHLKTLADGSLAEELVGTGWRKQNRGANPGANRCEHDDAGSHLPQTAEELEPQGHGGALRRRRAPEPEPSELDGDVDELISRMLGGEVLSLVDAERMKANGLALRQFVNARRDAGALVEVELAERVLFEEARKIRDAWLNWPARAGPPMAAALGVDAERVVEVLTAHVHEQLDSFGDPEADFSA